MYYIAWGIDVSVYGKQTSTNGADIVKVSLSLVKKTYLIFYKKYVIINYKVKKGLIVNV
jgi:hypothetical protein